MIAIADVHVKDRHRTDPGDLEGLATSLRELGQLQPIVVSADYLLIAGGRRLTAAKSLGWTEIEAKIASDLTGAADLLRAERDENTCRKAFAPTEEYSLYAALLALDSQTSAGAAANGGQSTGPEGRHGTRARQSVSEIVTGNAGRHKTLEKIGDVKRIADDPGRSERLRQKAREALAEMDQTGVIAGPHTRVILAAKAEETRNDADLSGWSEEERFLLKELRAGHTIVVSFREHHSNIVRWAQADGLLVSVDRRTEWGNPFELPYDGDRETVIANYADHFLPHKPSLLSRLHELRGKALACWCSPAPCHGDVLKAQAGA
jgi:Domain of unknown function (DUF4326)/ParB-like nuclease domain